MKIRLYREKITEKEKDSTIIQRMIGEIFEDFACLSHSPLSTTGYAKPSVEFIMHMKSIDPSRGEISVLWTTEVWLLLRDPAEIVSAVIGVASSDAMI